MIYLCVSVIANDFGEKGLWKRIFISVGGVLKKGWDEIPEVIASSVLALVGLGLGGIGIYNYYAKDGDNRRYKLEYTGKYMCQVRGKIRKLNNKVSVRCCNYDSELTLQRCIHPLVHHNSVQCIVTQLLPQGLH